MKRTADEQEELEFFFDEEAEDDSNAQHEEDEPGSWDQEQGPAPSGGGADGLEGPGSNKSATTLHDSEDEDAFRTSVVMRQPGMHPVMPSAVASSMPARHIQMGSSVPMNIPFLQAGKPPKVSSKKDREEQPAELHYPGTFIPPHELSQRDGSFMFSLSGASPSAAKRDRLKARNAIMRATGFLENSGPLPALTPALQERAKFVAMAGGLSQTFKVEGVRGLAL